MRTVAFCLLLSITLSGASLAHAQQEQTTTQAPETIEEAKGFGLEILQQLPNAVKGVWDNQVVPLWNGMWNITKDVWNTYIFSWINPMWERTLAVFDQEIEQRKPVFQEEFQKEKQELKEEVEEKIPEQGKTLWEHIKGLFRKDGGGE